ncbi:MAG: hypothetical protein SOT91_04185 [Bacilli bacterium]|nr:hypothetical protein [Bacilli bacterium]
MKIVVLWISTVAASFCIELTNELRMFKDVADAGYKINIDRLSDLSKKLNPDASKITLLSMLIPIFNIIQVFERITKYNNIRPMLLDQLSIIDALEEMSEIEKQEYQKRPTGLNAILVPFKLEVRIAKADSVKIENDNEKSEIFYEIGDSLDDITILKVAGDAYRLTEAEQKKKVIEAIKSSLSEETEEYDDVENATNTIKDNDDLELKNTDNKEEQKVTPKQESSLSRQKQALEDLKNKLIEEKEQAAQKSPAKTKKRKRK